MITEDGLDFGAYDTLSLTCFLVKMNFSMDRGLGYVRNTLGSSRGVEAGVTPVFENWKF